MYSRRTILSLSIECLAGLDVLQHKRPRALATLYIYRFHAHVWLCLLHVFQWQLLPTWSGLLVWPLACLPLRPQSLTLPRVFVSCCLHSPTREAVNPACSCAVEVNHPR